jgi:hypothetical protein
MVTYAVLEAKMTWSSCGFRATRSYLNAGKSTVHFVSHTGIKPTGESVAATAAMWLGWQSAWMVEYEGRCSAKSAEQSLPDKDAPTYTYSEPTTDERRARKEREARWQREDKEREAKAKEDAARVAAAMTP